MIAKLREKLVNPETPLSTKYRVLFALKGNEENEAHSVLLAGLNDPSALLRHEVAYCLGTTLSTQSNMLDLISRPDAEPQGNP